MASNSRPQKYRRILEVEAFPMDNENGEKVARWCGGRYTRNVAPENADLMIHRVLVPYFDASGNISVMHAIPGDFIIKHKDGTHDVWSAEKFKEEGLEPFYHRGGRDAVQSDD